jgi:GH35 family endo-1,4-beta-xylanase
VNSVDAVGLQFYPGYHLNSTFGDLEGPAKTPSWLVDTIEDYGRFGKPIHITEFSVPSSYGENWNAGYWREPWTETTQADYAEAILTLAFGNSNVQSVTWWDISDANSSVVTGGIMNAQGQPKQVYTRIQQLLKSWTTDLSGKTGSTGRASLSGFGGTYDVVVTLPTGKTVNRQIHLNERQRLPLTIKVTTR